MMRSMTSFGSARKGGLQVEIHSVNRKGLEMAIALPKNMLSFDLSVRKLLSQEIHRGQVTVRVTYAEKENLSFATDSFKALKSKWDKISTDLGFDPSREINLNFLVARGLEEDPSSPEEPLPEMIKPLLVEALGKFIVMREKEGANLLKDLQLRLKEIKDFLKSIESKLPAYEQSHAEQLKEKLKTLSEVQDEDKILKEVMAYMKKTDVHEEAVRLYSHISQVEELITSKEASIGRVLDVLMQEMGREINTLMAKMEDTEITKLSIKIKGSINKMQEQVQNIE